MRALSLSGEQQCFRGGMAEQKSAKLRIQHQWTIIISSLSKGNLECELGSSDDLHN